MSAKWPEKTASVKTNNLTQWRNYNLWIARGLRVHGHLEPAFGLPQVYFTVEYYFD